MGGEVEIGFGGVWAMGVDIGSKIIDAGSYFPHKSGAGRHPFRGKSYWGDHCSASERFVALKSKGVAAGLKCGVWEDGGKRKQRLQRSQGDRMSQVVTLNAVNEAGHNMDNVIEEEVVGMLEFGVFVRFDASQLAESFTGGGGGL